MKKPVIGKIFPSNIQLIYEYRQLSGVINWKELIYSVVRNKSECTYARTHLEGNLNINHLQLIFNNLVNLVMCPHSLPDLDPYAHTDIRSLNFFMLNLNRVNLLSEICGMSFEMQSITHANTFCRDLNSHNTNFFKVICHLSDFNLFHFWGPLASIESSRWIARAAVETMSRLSPDLMLVYLPHLDYCSQKYGPNDPVIQQELRQVDQEVGRIVNAA